MTSRWKGCGAAILLTSLLCWCSLPSLTRAFSMGAPDSACASMVPGHGVAPQDTPSPFSVQMSPWEDARGRRLVNLTLQSEQGLQFAGFLVQARPETGGNALGSFVVDTSNSKTHTCGSGLRNSVTHTNKNMKKRVVLVWEAPEDYSGVVVFNATFVGDYSTFWTNVRSEKFRINKRSAEGPGLETSTRRPTTRPPSTTRAPETTSTTAKTAQLKPTVSKLATSVYTDCNVNKGCFGIPAGCIESQRCEGLLTYVVRGETYEFELLGAAGKAWVAGAFSDDRNMGLDSVMECIYEGNEVKMLHSWNEEVKGANHKVENPGVELLNASYVDNNLYCRFTRARLTTVEGVQFDLDKPYFLLVAAGKDFTPNKLGYHYEDRDVTAEAVKLSDVSKIEAASKILVRLHGAFMLAAWIGAASMGILLARYFKQTWVGSQLCGKDQWFAWHRMLMVLTWLLTVTGFILIFVELKAWSAADSPHAILGVITTALAFIQPFMAALRPHPGTPKRPIFNWAHWLVGNLAHIFAIVTIFFAVQLVRAELPDWMTWVLVAFVAFHVCMHFIFSIVGCASDRQTSARVTSFPMKDMGNSRSQLHGMPDRKMDAAYSPLRKFLLAIYIIGVVGLAVAMIVITVLAPIETTFDDLKSRVGLN